MRISRAKARKRVERAIFETRPELKSAAWATAWRGIHQLRSRGRGDDGRIADELAGRMLAAARARS